MPAPTPIDAADNPGFEDDTETVDGASVGGDEGGPEATPVGPPIVFGRQVRGQQEAFASLDGVDLKDRLVHTISPKIITVLTRYRPIVLELI